TAAAEQADRQALEILSGLVSEDPAERGNRDALAQAHRELGAVLRTEERWPESERELKEAAASWDVLTRERPGIAEYRSKMADAHGSRGDQYQIQGRIEEAKGEFRHSLELADRLAWDHPEVSAYQESLANNLHDFARLQANKLDDIPGSIGTSLRAVEIS